jgi:peptidoglycan/xylan/chitin deacetylase (PgdA/CDA1 family)
MSLVWAGAGVAAAAGVGLVARGMFSPRSRLLGPVVFRGTAASPPRVALTFDDGPDERATPRILEVLQRYEVPAAFFVIGRNVERHPALVEQIHRAGHLVGNHSYHHDRLGTFRRLCYWRQELARTDSVIAPIVGGRPRLFRPPMGFRNWHIARAVREGGYVATTWTARAFDSLNSSAARILERLDLRSEAGSILALHDGQEPGRCRDLASTIEALPQLIERLRDRGLEPVRLDDLIGERPYRQDASVPETADASR